MPLTQNTQRAFEIGDYNEHPVLANANIYEGAAVGIQASTGSFARPLTATDRFVGFAESPANNVGGANGAIRVRVRERGKVELAVAGASATSVGLAVYASDDGTFTLTSSGNSKIGWVHRHVSGTTVVVAFDSVLANTSAT